MLSRSRFNPVPGAMDLWTYLRQPQPYRLPILLVSFMPLALILWWATEETILVPPAPPEVTYITSFSPDRSDEEIAASNEANQQRKDERRAQIEEIEERKRQMYRDLGRATGVDVDAMEARIEAERAAEEAAEAQAASETGGTIATDGV